MRQKTALLFDDDEMCRNMLSDILAEKQFKVQAFTDPTSFLTHQEKTCCHQDTHPCFDVLLTDMHMPGMTELEFLERLKGFGCKIPDHNRAIISGNWSVADLKRAEQFNCKTFHKPTPMDEIFSWLDECAALIDQAE